VGELKLVVAKQQVRRCELEGKTPPLPKGKFDLILLDPPYPYKCWKSTSRAVANHYPTMTVEEISALPVQKLCADDCVLFLWVPAPQLATGLELIRRWGFQYRTGAVWDKRTVGTGSYFRTRHEHLLLATKGDPRTPNPSNRPPSVFASTRTSRHSEKPQVAYEIIERMYPRAKRLELFARATRHGWSTWGNEVEQRA
jgi:N6-adenosine-specific RNA methylase IME4